MLSNEIKTFKFVSWNVRGLNDKKKRSLVKDVIKNASPQIVCMQETKWSTDNKLLVKETVGPRLQNYEMIEAKGTAGGVLIAWDQNLFTKIDHEKGDYCLSIDFTVNLDSSVFRYTGVYGPANQQDKPLFFQELREAKPNIQMPWMVAGDFNVTLRSQDRANNNYPTRHMMRFRALADELQLIDMRLQGRKFTWSNERTFVRLDRFLTNLEWTVAYPNTTQMALESQLSDHCPLQCSIQTKFPSTNIFRIENSWLKIDQFRQLVNDTWRNEQVATNPTQLYNKMKRLTKEIVRWKREYLKRKNYQKKLCSECMQWMVVQGENRSLTEVEKLLKELLGKRQQQLVIMEEERWKQRAKQLWVQQGDKNTRFFHQMATIRKRKNMVQTITQGDVQIIEHRGKAKVFFQHFVKLVGTTHQQGMSFDYERLYQDQQNQAQEQIPQLTEMITEEEIKAMINALAMNKSPGPDGYTNEFFKEFRDLILQDLLLVYNNVLTGEQQGLEPLNDSYIVLIPKKELPTTPGDFRPISLINSVQKMFSKLLANRVQPIMELLISKNQTGFVKGRHISEGFLYAQEVITMATKQKKKMGLFKADIFKAFDTLSWEFLAQIMRARGFSERWIQCITRAVLTGSSKVLLNSTAGKKIILRRGVRQGDPLSPYLFILAMDFLSRWTEKLTSLGLLQVPFQGCKPCLLFADDTLFMIRPIPQQLQFLKIILHMYGELSGLRVNLNKSEVLVTTALPEEIRDLAEIMDCEAASFPITYLGLPLTDKKLQKMHYLPLIQKITGKLTTWKADMLSIGGRITLINAALTAVPIYMMQVFLLPKWVINKIDQSRRKFLWHGHKVQVEGKRYMSLASWELVTKSKKMGGLGVKNLHTMNKALMAKVIWKWHQIDRPIWMEVAAKENVRPWEITTTTRFWKSFREIAKFMEFSIQFKIGKGDHVRFWTDKWMQQPLCEKYPILYQYTERKEMTVQQAWQGHQWQLSVPQIMSVWAQEEQQQLLAELQDQIIDQSQQHQDEVQWKWNDKGIFTVKSFYITMEQKPYIGSMAQYIWDIKGPGRVMIFIWLMYNNRLLTIDNLIKKGWEMPNMCHMCRMQSETKQHLFQECAYIKRVKIHLSRLLPAITPNDWYRTTGLGSIVNRTEQKSIRQIQVTICFVVWRERCRRIFTDNMKEHEILAREIAQEAQSWFGIT